jgi:Putative Ig domain/NlpC/P60 family
MRSLSSRNTVARALIAVLLLSVSLTALGVSVDTQQASATSVGEAIVIAASSQAHVPYCEGGGGINGPSSGNGCAPPTVGFDCMSLAQYAVYQATSVTVPSDGEMLPGPNSTDWDGQGTYIASQATFAEDEAVLQPGDVVFFGGGDMWHYAHSGIWVGDGQDAIWDALQTGTPVETHTLEYLTADYGEFDGAARYTGSPPPATFGLTTTSLPAATIGTAYSVQLTAAGGKTPYDWKVTGLPRGLKVNKGTGIIAGTVKISRRSPPAGTYPVEATVTDHSRPKQAATASLSLTLNPAS